MAAGQDTERSNTPHSHAAAGWRTPYPPGRTCVPLLALVFCTACGESTGNPDGSTAVDSGQDASTDSGQDASIPSDSGPSDAGPLDSGPGTPVSCESTADCPADTVCTVEANATTNRIDQLCKPYVGTLPNGAPCTDDLDCHAGLECGGPFGQMRCAGPCDVTNQRGCVTGTTCYPNIIYVNFASTFDSYSMCLADVGSYQVCTHDGDCPTGEACNLRFDETRSAVEGRCARFDASDKDPGQACTSNAECKSNGCLIGLGDTCFGMCQNTSQCPVPATCTLTVPAGGGLSTTSCEIP